MDHSTRFTLFYGSFATIALFLFWLYCMFLILLFGGLYNRYREERRCRHDAMNAEAS